MFIKKILLSLILLLSIALFSVEMTAQTEENQGISIEKGNFQEDYYFAGEGLEFRGEASDLLFAGKSLLFRGKTSKSLFAAGKLITVEGNVGNDFYGVGKSITSEKATVTEQFLAAAKAIQISKGSTVEGTAILAGADVEINGSINGNLYVAGGNVRLNGLVKGDVKCYAGKIHLGERARIDGNFRYASEKELSQNELKQVRGNVTWSETPIGRHHGEKAGKKVRRVFKVVLRALSLWTLLAAGLLLLLFPVFKKIRYGDHDKLVKARLVWGLIPFFVYFAAIIVGFVLVVTWPVSFLLIAAAIPVGILTSTLGLVTAGEFLFRKFKWNQSNRFVYFLFSFLIFALLSMVPVIGIITRIGVSALGWGVVLEGLFQTKFIKEGSQQEQINHR